MIPKSFDAITKEDIDALVTNKVAEVKTLEYKQELPGGIDKDKKEFLADISSFANASGGDIIYGLAPELDENGNPTGAPKEPKPITEGTPDAIKLRLEEIIRNGLTPRLPVQIDAVSGWGEDGKGFVIVIRVPQSIASPHMVTFKGTSRFFARHSSGKYQLDVDEIRSAFLATESQGERIRQFLADRLAKIMADETPVPLSTRHRLVLHVIPVTSFIKGERYKLQDFSPLIGNLSPVGKVLGGTRYSIDGFTCYTSESVIPFIGSSHGYCLMTFSGVVESVTADTLRYEEGGIVTVDTGFISATYYEKAIVGAVQSYAHAFMTLNIDGPFAISLTLLGCKGSWIYTDPGCVAGPENPMLDRDAAVFPMIALEELDAGLPKKLRPLFDSLWNAYGHPCCPHYDKDGNWILAQ